MNNKKLMIICGGTGGHVFPALEIANFLKKKGWKIYWIGTKERIESVLVPQYGFKINYVDILSPSYFYKKNILKKIIYIIKIFFSFKKIFFYINKFKPNLVLGMGNYISGIGCLAAWIKRIPIVIHEQNKVAGISNRLISKIAKKTLQAFPGAINNAEVVGNPIRKKILNLIHPKKRLINRSGAIKILVIGGSQGSHLINKIIPKVSFFLNNKINIWHQTGKIDKKKVIISYKKNNFYNYKVESFIKNIEIAYNWADLVISRSGALTISEIASVGIPSILVPFKHKDCQQYWNAMILKKANAAKIICQDKFTALNLVKIIKKLNRIKLFNMAQNAYSIAIKNSTEKIAYILNKELNKFSKKNVKN